LCVKAKNHFRAAFADMARCLIDVDAPGPASAGLFHYKFHHAPNTSGSPVWLAILRRLAA